MKILAILPIALLAGCGAQIGPSFSSLPDGTIDSRNAQGPSRINLTKGGETWTSESVTDGTYMRFMTPDAASIEVLGPKARVLEIPLPGGGIAKAASDTDASFSIAEATLPDGTILKGFVLTTNASPVIRARNEALTAFANVLVSRDQESAKAILSNQEMVKAIVEAMGPSVIDLIAKIAAGA